MPFNVPKLLLVICRAMGSAGEKIAILGTDFYDTQSLNVKFGDIDVKAVVCSPKTKTLLHIDFHRTAFYSSFFTSSSHLYIHGMHRCTLLARCCAMCRHRSKQQAITVVTRRWARPRTRTIAAVARFLLAFRMTMSTSAKRSCPFSIRRSEQSLLLLFMRPVACTRF